MLKQNMQTMAHMQNKQGNNMFEGIAAASSTTHGVDGARVRSESHRRAFSFWQTIKEHYLNGQI
jgi:hypothetical protein